LRSASQIVKDADSFSEEAAMLGWVRSSIVVGTLLSGTACGGGDDPPAHASTDTPGLDAARPTAREDAGADGGPTILDARAPIAQAEAGRADAGVADAAAPAQDHDAATSDPGDAGDGDYQIGPMYPKDPDLTDKGAPKGRLFGDGQSPITLRSSDSKIYQGTDKTLLPENQHSFTRSVSVYIPAQYKDGTEAPLLVIQDGPGPLTLVSRALDNLTIAKDPARKLPAFVVVTVGNGGDDSKGSERGLEYDTMSDRYARFVDSEVLPAVLGNAAIKAVYPHFAITKDPEGRATMGCSSGAAAAVTMGWFRPDLFRRVLSYSGTLVDQQDDDAAEEMMYPLGAWDYHSGKALIANSDKKPLRVVLHVSELDNGHDAPESGHHNWVIANQRTAAALGAKGYHRRFVTALGVGHCDGKVYDTSLADSLVWLWRGYQAP
jgi:enterochelin esterase family protein